MSNIKLYVEGKKIFHETKKFFSGELSVKVDIASMTFASIPRKIKIEAKITSSDDLIELCMLSNALDESYFNKLNSRIEKILHLDYIPGSRGDRVMESGGSFDLKVYANIINSLNFKIIYCRNPHSQATELLINNLHNVSDLNNYINLNDLFNKYGKNDVCLVAPDAGASKKVSEIATRHKLPMIQALKTRSLDNSKVEVNVIPFENNLRTTAIIIDDILDGGRTFIETAKALKEDLGMDKVILVVTHAMFSYGPNGLFDYIDEIYYESDWPGMEERLGEHKAKVKLFCKKWQ